MIWANYSVKDANRSREFYSKLGFTPNGPNNEAELASFKFGNNNFVIHFFQEGPKIGEYLSAWTNTNNEIMFTLSANSKEEVLELANKVKESCGTIIKEPNTDEQGYYGFIFADPDGHKFNVLLMKEGM